MFAVLDILLGLGLFFLIRGNYTKVYQAIFSSWGIFDDEVLNSQAESMMLNPLGIKMDSNFTGLLVKIIHIILIFK